MLGLLLRVISSLLVLLALVPLAQAVPPPVPRPAAQSTVPPPETPEEARAREMAWEYIFGDADAAVAYFARRWPPKSGGLSPLPTLPSAWSAGPMAPDGRVIDRFPSPTSLGGVLLSTEVGMRAGVFGKYANSAPLVSAKGVVGLTGMFEFQSLRAYRDVCDLLEVWRNVAVPPAGRDEAISAIRSWFVVTTSHCLRWKLDCADAIVAGATKQFAADAEILLLDGAVAEVGRQTVRAKNALRLATAADPSLAEAHLRYGRLLVAQDDFTEGRRELQFAFDRAASPDAAFTRYLAALSLADLDERAGRTTSAAARRKTAATLKPFADPLLANLTPEEIYAAGQFYQQSRRIAALRAYVRQRQ